jgi:cytochrome c
MKPISSLLRNYLTLTSLALCLLATSGRTATPAEEASALVKEAGEFVKANGKGKAFEAFTDAKGRFVKGDLYIFVVDFEGQTLAHGGNAKLVGKNMKDLKDADGKSFIQEMIECARKGGGWVDYKWTNPNTRRVQAKSTLVQPLPEGNAFLGCGIYK